MTFLCMFIFVSQLFAFNGEAQNKVVNLQSENLSIEELFKEIEQQTDYLIIYSTSEIKSNFDISLNRKNNPPKQNQFFSVYLNFPRKIKGTRVAVSGFSVPPSTSYRL